MKNKDGQKQQVIVLGIIHIGDKVLIIKRKEKDAAIPDMVWAFPGGKLREGESPEESLIRELKEEVGLNVKLKKLLFIRLYPGTQILQRFYDCEPEGNQKPKTNEPDEIEEIRWVKASQVQEHFTSNIHHFILGFLQGISSQEDRKQD